ncbi:hypothetical protein [Humidisolicoccus flavus]|uniref:hypothetical protein n=1 Tax=Humidisolicoccus flavus TaxID=3111414 RepID=UPI0032546A8B
MTNESSSRHRSATKSAATRRSQAKLAGVAAVTATCIALISHLLGGGAMPGLLGIVIPLILAMPVCLLLAKLRNSVARLGLSVTVSQFLFHTLFVFGAQRATAPSAAPAASSHDHSGHAAFSAATSDLATGASHSGHDGPLMWVMHALAAVVTTLILAHGEAILVAFASVKQIAAALFLRRTRLHEPLPIASAPNTALTTLDWVPALRTRSSAIVQRRGPPVVL